MQDKILVIGFPIPGAWDASEATSQLTRILRVHDRSLRNDQVVQLPIVDGGVGTIDFLVTHSLGSFLEVEASNASGEDSVVPIGFAGEGGKLAVVEMARVAGVTEPGERGTTRGIGELIQDALDEGAFSIFLGHEEPLACDAGLGAAAALGVRFFSKGGRELDMGKPGTLPSDVARIDVSGKSFALLSSRIFIGRSKSSTERGASDAFKQELERLAEIVRRDVGVPAIIGEASASGVEFGLSALFGAECRPGVQLVLEAAQIAQAIERDDFASAVILIPDGVALETSGFADILPLISKHIPNVALIPRDGSAPNGKRAPGKTYSLKDVQLFQAPLTAGSGIDEIRRDLIMRLEKVVPTILEGFAKKSSSRAKSSGRA